MKRRISESARFRAMSIDAFCARYGLGRTKTYEELKSGRLRGRKIGKRTIICEEDAENWLRHLPVIQPNSILKGAPPTIAVRARAEGREP
jgi:hypothetical protein